MIKEPRMAKALAERFGAAALLDEMRWGDDLIPTFKTMALIEIAAPTSNPHVIHEPG
jgi:hypothetical protein